MVCSTYYFAILLIHIVNVYVIENNMLGLVYIKVPVGRVQHAHASNIKVVDFIENHHDRTVTRQRIQVPPFFAAAIDTASVTPHFDVAALNSKKAANFLNASGYRGGRIVICLILKAAVRKLYLQTITYSLQISEHTMLKG